MNKSGFLRRAVILLGLGMFYSAFVISDSQIITNEEHRQWLHGLLIGAVAWGIVTMLADRIAPPRNGKEENDDAE